jgi:hypothetical protein
VEKLIEIAKQFIRNKPVKILDIGGTSGYFANSLAMELHGECEIVVVDNTEYENWKTPEFAKQSIDLDICRFPSVGIKP